MSPEFKAQELISAFENPCNQSKANIWGKECAIICVEQIIGEWDELNGDPDTETVWSEEKSKYWNEVLGHIKNS